MAAAASPQLASKPEKKHKKDKSEKKRTRDEEDAPADEPRHKKSKSAPEAVKLEEEPELELKTEKKKKKKDKKNKRGPEFDEPPAAEGLGEEKRKKKRKEASGDAAAAAAVENDEVEKKHKKSKHSEDTAAVKKHKRKHAEATVEADEDAEAPAAFENDEAETKHRESKHDDEAVASDGAPVLKERKKKHKKKHKEAGGAEAEAPAAAEAPATASAADEAVVDKKHKKKKSKGTHKDAVVADEAGDADGKKTKSKEPAAKDGGRAAGDGAMDVDEPGPRTSSKTYQPPDMPADAQFPFFSQTVSLYEPLYPTGWAQPVTNAQYQHLQHLENRYVPSLRGVLLGYKNVAVGPTPGRHGAATHDEAPTTLLSRNEYAVGFAWITADVELFVPSRGAWMEGCVNLQTEGHIGVVCFSRFNASIEARRLPPAWTWVSNESPEALGVEETASVVTADDHGVVRQVHSTGFWVDGAGARVGGRVRFRIRNFDAGASGDVSYLSLEGTMLDGDSEKRLVREEAFTAQMRREKKGACRPGRRRAPDFSMTRFADDAKQPAQAAGGDGEGAK